MGYFTVERFNLGQKATRFAAKRDFVHRVQPDHLTTYQPANLTTFNLTTFNLPTCQPANLPTFNLPTCQPPLHRIALGEQPSNLLTFN
ncbi:hypothetical protein BJP36_16045 [Moorena producens JHB]|uniref:Uncharacterized protein n=1 Tax=Moorena producens (strain JHB) TaxID=1454205 RepID=A0A1D9G187_MOOP1|nr:hypothetical protein [Moorena producens]AOY81190.1 hypothetical protein BJP36_16045 [Moorena producens JHB]